MNKNGVWAIALLLALPIFAHGEDAPPAASRYGSGGGRPSDAQIAEWRAKREAQAAAVPAAAEQSHEHQHGSAPANVSAAGKPTMRGKPEETSRGGGRPGGMPSGMRGAGALWLSDTPPMRGDGARGGRGGMGGMAGMEMGGGERGGPAVKRLWLRSGNDPQRSGFAQQDVEAEVETVLVKPFGKPEGEALPQAENEHMGLSFEMPTQGFYRLYQVSRKLQGDTLNVNVAKAEVGNFGHGGDPDEAARAMQEPRVLESALIEIVRERKPDEKKFFQLRSGEEQAFIVLRKGLPVQGARVRFVSHIGWSKEAISDEQGRVSFQVVRDYFPPWNDFQKRFKATYLVIAETGTPEAGKFRDKPYTGTRYQATLSGNYYPSPDDYLSYAWGLGIGLAITLFCGVAVYLYRRRRVKPYREERIHDGK